MTRRLCRKAALALLVLPLAAVPPTAAAAPAGAGPGVAYEFAGRLLADPPAGANALTLRVHGGNHRALRVLLGHRATQAFRVDGATRYLRWSAGVPAVVGLDDLRPGDRVRVRIRAGRGATLEAVTATPATRVADRDGPRVSPRLPVWVFRGSATGPAADGRVAVHVSGGNGRALRALLGHGRQRTFRYADTTVFLRWTAVLPSVVTAAEIEAGDRVTVRIRAPRGAALPAILARPAVRIAEHTSVSGVVRSP